MGSRGGQPATRAEACTWFLRAFFGVVQQETTIKDFSNVSDEAADFMIIWEIGDSAYDVEDLANLLESVLDIAIGGYDFGDIDDDSLDEQDEQRQFEVHQSLLNIWDLLSQRGLTQTSDTVYVTRRRVVRRFGIDSNWHAALEYVSASTLGLNPTIAAYNSGGFFVSGQLVSRLNQLSEHNNIVAGIVTSLIYPTGARYGLRYYGRKDSTARTLIMHIRCSSHMSRMNTTPMDLLQVSSIRFSVRPMRQLVHFIWVHIPCR